MEMAIVGLGVGPSAGTVEAAVRLTRRVDITATLRHHENLQTNMSAGALAAARDATAARIGDPEAGLSMQKSPFHVQLAKVQAALERAKSCGEEAGRGLCRHRSCDKAVGHAVSLRQRPVELTERINTGVDAHMSDDHWGLEDGYEAGGSWSGWQWEPCGVTAALDGGGKYQGGGVWLAAGAARCPSGLVRDDGRVTKHGCGCCWAAAGSGADDNCCADPVQAEPRDAGEPVGAVDPESAPRARRIGARCTARTSCLLAQRMEDSSSTSESPYSSVQWVTARGTQNSWNKTKYPLCRASPRNVNEKLSVGLVGVRVQILRMCEELTAPLEEVTQLALKELEQTPMASGIPADTCNIVVCTDGGAVLRPREGAVASWSFDVLLKCGNEVLRVIGCASGRVKFGTAPTLSTWMAPERPMWASLKRRCCAVALDGGATTGRQLKVFGNTIRLQTCSCCSPRDTAMLVQTLAWCIPSDIIGHA